MYGKHTHKFLCYRNTQNLLSAVALQHTTVIDTVLVFYNVMYQCTLTAVSQSDTGGVTNLCAIYIA